MKGFIITTTQLKQTLSKLEELNYAALNIYDLLNGYPIGELDLTKSVLTLSNLEEEIGKIPKLIDHPLSQDTLLNTMIRAELCEPPQAWAKLQECYQDMRKVVSKMMIDVVFDTNIIRYGGFEVVKNQNLEGINLVVPMAVMTELMHEIATKTLSKAPPPLQGFPSYPAREAGFAVSSIMQAILKGNCHVYGEQTGKYTEITRAADFAILEQARDYAAKSRYLAILITGDYALSMISDIPTLYMPKTIWNTTPYQAGRRIKIPKDKTGDFLYSLCVTLGITALETTEHEHIIISYSWKGMTSDDKLHRKLCLLTNTEWLTNQLISQTPKINTEHACPWLPQCLQILQQLAG